MRTSILIWLRRRQFGLRARIVGVVVITTAVTLGVAALVLLPRLESSLTGAAMKTLENEVAAASRHAVFTQLSDIPYTVPSELPTGAAAKTKRARAEQANAQSLLAIEAELRARLGATDVCLIGYMAEDGHGKPVVVPGNTPGSANACYYGDPGIMHDVQRAYLFREKVFSFGGASEVRASIPLNAVNAQSDAVFVVRKSIDEVPTAVAAVRRAFEIALIPGVLLTLLLAIPLAARLVRRLGRLRQAALRLAIDGVGAEFPLDRARDEVGDLARSFAIVQRRLRQQEEARRAFVATASHELRTPLASLEGMLELLAEDLEADDVDLEDAARLLDRARAQSQRLARLAADLLDLSRIDADVRLRSEPVELGELGRAVLAEFELRAVERGVSATLDDGGAAAWALADPGSVARILRILMDNALRVAPAGSSVSVLVHDGLRPSLSVVDRGPGVAREERSLIFERFKRGRETGGTAGFGLGLAIGHELAERMGGSLVLAEGDGIGATFTLTLRASHAPTVERETSGATGV